MSEPITQKQFVTANEQIGNGERVYMANCQKCHPAGGEGGLGPSLLPNPAPQFIKRFQMRHGLGAILVFIRKKFQEKTFMISRNI